MAIRNRIASDGMPIAMTDSDYRGVKLSIIYPANVCYPERAGKTITVDPCWRITYNEKGYKEKVENMSGTPAGPARSITFVNEAVKNEGDLLFQNGYASSDDGAIWAVFDGAGNLMGHFDLTQDEPMYELTGDEALVERKMSFYYAFKEEYCKKNHITLK